MKASRLQSVILAFLFLTASILLATPPAVFASTVLGDANIEPVMSTLNAQYVEALTKVTAGGPTVIHSVSMYLQYSWSDGSQCLKFAIYGDNGESYGQSSPLNEPLISRTENGYCFVTGNFGPAWETWTLQPSDYLTIPAAGAYWIAVLPEQSYGTIYHFSYTGLFPSQALYTYGYYMYAFPASYTLGFPPTVFAAAPAYGYVFQPSDSGNVGNYNAPYSLYVTGS